jgi:predicted ATP-dependent endonuclease of OLD family
MKVTRIHAEHFLGYDSLDLELPEKISVFVGKNGSGKSSILDAIRAAFLGTARCIPRGDSSTLGRDGHNWSVELDLVKGETNRTIRRTATTLSKVDDGKKIKVAQADLDRALGDPKALEAALDVWKATKMTSADRQALVFKLAKVKVSEEELKEKGLLHPDVRRQALVGNWKKAESTAAELKRAEKRVLENLNSEPPDDAEIQLKQVTKLSEISDDMLRAMKAKVAELQQQERDLTREVGRLEGRTQASAEGLAERATELQAEIDALTAKNLPTRHLEAKQAIKDEKALRDAVAESLEKIRLKRHNAGMGKDDCEHDIGIVEKAGAMHACPICGDEHEAEASPEEVKKLKASLAEAESTIKDCDEKLEQGEAAHEKHEARLIDLRAEAQDLKAEDDRHADLQRELKETEAKIETAAEPSTAEDLAKANGDLEKAQTSLGRGRLIVRQVETYRSGVEAHKDEQGRRQVLADNALAYEAMEKLCRPGGLRSELLAPTLDPIRERLSGWSQILPFEIELTDDFNIRVIRDGASMSLDLCSASEQWRVSLAVADALAQLAGLRFLALDEVSLLDKSSRNTVIRTLVHLADDYDQVIACAVLNEPVKPAPGGTDLQFYLVEDGRVEAVVAEEGVAA